MHRRLKGHKHFHSVLFIGGIFLAVCFGSNESFAQTAISPTSRFRDKDSISAQPGKGTDTSNSNIRRTQIPVLRIGSGDLLEINIFGAPELTQKSRVEPEGNIVFPLVGKVHVAGLTAEAAARALETRLVDAGIMNQPAVTVFISEYATQGATVVGEVNKPGTYPILGSRRLLDVISVAGGLTAKSGKQVTITHRDQYDRPVTVALPRDLDDLSESNIEILPGDTIAVSKAGVVYVVGDVGKPGGFSFDGGDNLTVLQVLALAEGAKSTASLDHARVIRKTDTGLHDLPIPLRKILAAKSADQKLEPNDILFVPNSAAKSAIRRSTESILQIATGAAIYRF